MLKENFALVVDVVISLVVVEPQDIKVDTTAPLTMFTINPSLLPSPVYDRRHFWSLLLVLASL